MDGGGAPVGIGTVIAGWQLTTKIGEGAGCIGVYDARNAEGEEVAIKIVDRQRAHNQHFQRELDIAFNMEHPNVIELAQVEFFDQYVALIMEKATGGELYSLVAKDGPMSEDNARIYFQQIVSAVYYCHSQGICHRDLKLENCLLAAEGSMVLKITDFGVSKDLSQHSQPRTKKVGTISYMAPEVGQASGDQPYDGAAADIWSMGVLLYVLVLCKYPFGFDGKGGEPTGRVLQKIKAGVFTFPAEPAVTDELKQLISGMLANDLAERATLDQIVAHAWFNGEIDTGGPPEPDDGAALVKTRSIDWERLGPRVSSVDMGEEMGDMMADFDGSDEEEYGLEDSM